jgi:PadR family transcriptional regulator PadR
VQRLSRPQRAILLRLAADAPSYGFALASQLGLSTATVYPALQRLEDAGLLTSELERGDAAALGRRPRRLYRLTKRGTGLAAELPADPARTLPRGWREELGWFPAR